jgi:hypothetical protein
MGTSDSEPGPFTAGVRPEIGRDRPAARVSLSMLLDLGEEYGVRSFPFDAWEAGGGDTGTGAGDVDAGGDTGASGGDT